MDLRQPQKRWTVRLLFCCVGRTKQWCGFAKIQAIFRSAGKHLEQQPDARICIHLGVASVIESVLKDIAQHCSMVSDNVTYFGIVASITGFKMHRHWIVTLQHLWFWTIDIVWVGPPPSNSDHHDYYISRIGDSKKQLSFATGILGGGHIQDIISSFSV